MAAEVCMHGWLPCPLLILNCILWMLLCSVQWDGPVCPNGAACPYAHNLFEYWCVHGSTEAGFGQSLLALRCAKCFEAASACCSGTVGGRMHAMFVCRHAVRRGDARPTTHCAMRTDTCEHMASSPCRVPAIPLTPSPPGFATSCLLLWALNPQAAS
jgi:hypothetical protein